MTKIVGSKESLGLKLKDGICAKFCFKLWFESGSVILLREDGFESNYPETVPNNHFLQPV